MTVAGIHAGVRREHLEDRRSWAVGDLRGRTRAHLERLVGFGPRPPGSPANRRATEYVAEVLGRAGGRVERLPFRARWWLPGEATLFVGSTRLVLDPPPFSMACDAAGPIRRVASDADIPSAAPGSILLLTGDIAQEPLFPKAFPFVQLPHQQARIDALERARPAAVLALATEADPQPRFEDPDLSFPYATLAASMAPLLESPPAARLVITGDIRSGDGENVSARAQGAARAVVSAHVDSKVTTPGGLDNGGGVAAVLAAVDAGLLDVPGVEVVLFNGEDHYAAPGEQAWLGVRDASSFALAINVDGVGLPGAPTTVAALSWPEQAKPLLDGLLRGRAGFVPTAPWYESDHALFAMAGVPSIALTSGGPRERLAQLSHSPAGGTDSVDPSILADVAAFLLDAVPSLLAELPPRASDARPSEGIATAPAG